MPQFSEQAYAKIKWQLCRFFDQIGLLGRGAILAILLLIGLFFIQWVALQHQLNNFSIQAVDAAPKAYAPLNQTQVLADYIAQFPKVNVKAQVFNTLMQLAKEQDLTLDAVAYKTKSGESVMPFSQTTMEFTLNASYPQIHDFINKIMVDMPFLTIEQWSFIRMGDEDALIESRIRLLFNFASE